MLAREWHNEGANAFVELSAAERKDASKALAILAEAGYKSVSLVDAARRTVGELEAEAPDSPAVREALEVVRRNVELEARLIDDLLDVTRISKGKLQLSFETICVHQILQRAYEICRKEIEAKNLEVDFQLHAVHTHVEGDPARLQQVFWNLIKNSVKFTPEKGRITIATLNPVPDKIEARIIDTGIGVEHESFPGSRGHGCGASGAGGIVHQYFHQRQHRSRNFRARAV